MEPTRQSDELYDAYVKVQKELWDRWMEIARQFEIATAPETAWWSYQFKVLDEPVQNDQEMGNTSQAWLQLWKDSLNHGNGVLAAMMEWNRRIIEHRAEANRQFLAAWKEAIRKLNKEKWDKSTQQSFQALQKAVEQAITMASEPSTQTAEPVQTPAIPHKHSEHAGRKVPAVKIYPH